jgi:hypothetical protein
MVVSRFVNGDVMMLVMVQAWLAGVDRPRHGGVCLREQQHVDTCDG